MSAIGATAATADTPPLSGSKEVSNDKALLDKDGFLKMLVAQMTHQDPTSPMDAAQQTQQMASFTMVEQITNMASENAKVAQTLNTSSSVALLGRTVTYVDADDLPHTGKVDSVSTSKDGVTTLTVAGTPGIDPTSITQVALTGEAEGADAP
jgi:flagellar basal-body rod modification protein FlgD